MTRMTGPDCVVMCNLINTHTHTHTHAFIHAPKQISQSRTQRADAGRDGRAEIVSRDQISSRERRQGKYHFSCSADHKQDWQPYPVDLYSAESAAHTYLHTSKIRQKTRERRQKKYNFSCSADHEQNWQPYSDKSADHTYIHTSKRRQPGKGLLLLERIREERGNRERV